MYWIVAVRYISTHVSMRDLLGRLAEELMIHKVTSNLVDDVGWGAM
jgi:hypothetical protein